MCYFSEERTPISRFCRDVPAHNNENKGPTNRARCQYWDRKNRINGEAAQVYVRAQNMR